MCAKNERCAYKHSIQSALGNYHKWQNVLESEASLKSRIVFWRRTVEESLLWALESSRYNRIHVKRLSTTQNLMFRQMMKSKTLVLPDRERESWVDWQKRTLRNADRAAVENACGWKNIVRSSQGLG